MTTITIDKELLEQVLAALETMTDEYDDSAVGLEIEAIHALRAALAAPATAPEQDVHPDDKAVDRFAGRMKWKLANARAKGKSGWQDRSWTPDQISAALRQHVDKGDPTDVANYCMFLAARGEPITSATAPEQEVSVKQVDANNYCLILRLFGMEEEGDPVAEIERLRKDAELMKEGLDAVEVLIDNSNGVAGLHLNGDLALWSELQTGGSNEGWLLAFDAAREAAMKGTP